MDDLNRMIVTDLEQPFIVHSEKGRQLDMKNRSTYGISLCISGQITYTMDGNRIVSDPGHAILLPQGGVYSLYGDREGLFPVANFRCRDWECREIRAFPLQNPQTAIRIFENIRNLFLFNESRLKIYSAFYELLDQAFSAALPARSPLSPLIEYIETHLADPALSNSLLAKQIGTSEVYMRKLFQAYSHTSPKQFILNIRIRKAKQLLTDTASTVTAISEACGFSSLYHFCRAFKEKTGTTPSRYAAEHRIYRI